MLVCGCRNWNVIFRGEQNTYMTSCLISVSSWVHYFLVVVMMICRRVYSQLLKYEPFSLHFREYAMLLYSNYKFDPYVCFEFGCFYTWLMSDDKVRTCSTPINWSKVYSKACSHTFNAQKMHIRTPFKGFVMSNEQYVLNVFVYHLASFLIHVFGQTQYFETWAASWADFNKNVNEV